MTILTDLHARRDAARATLAEINARIAALTPHPSRGLLDWQRGIAAERVVLFLRRHSLLTWSPAELILATQCTEAAVRRTLTRLVAERRIRRELHARYRHDDGPDGDAWKTRSVDELDLSVRASNCLLEAGIKTLGELTSLTPADLLCVKRVNKDVIKNIAEELTAIGLALRTPAPRTSEGTP